MSPSLEETVYIDFITSSPTTGAATDADSTPTCEVFEDATDTAILTPTVVKRTGKTGNYRTPVACTAANGFEAGKSYNVVVSATVGAVAAKAVIRTFQMRTNDSDDLAASILTRATPAQVQAELVTYGAAKPGNAMTLTSAYDPAKTAASQTSVNTVDARLDTEIPAIKAVTDKLDTALVIDGAVYQYTANALELAPVGGGGGDASQATLLQVKAKTDALPTDPADASDIAAQFATVNTTLATLSSYVDTEVAAIKSKTDALPPDPADASDIAASFSTVNTKLDSITTGLPLDAAELNAIADALLKRDWTAVSGEAAYSMLNACRMLRNVWNTTGGTLTVKKEDGASNAWQRTLAVDPSAQPIVGAS